MKKGGDVSRLQNIINNKLFSQKYFGEIFEKIQNLVLIFINTILMKFV